MNVKVIKADFVFGAHNMGQTPEEVLPEVAFVGRSNVGKSSLINRTLQRKALARTSSTPGHTQQINYYSVSVRDEEDGDHPLYFVDLPGYGYAKFSKARREVMSSLIVDYLQEREELGLVCLLNDSRRMPGEEELALRDLAFNAGRQLLVVLTKADKLKANDRKKQRAKLAAAYGLETSDLLLSGEKGVGESLWSHLLPYLQLRE
jgi:GTP-binding protein